MNKTLIQRQIAAIESALQVITEPTQVIEVRIIAVDGRKYRVDSGYFDDIGQLAKLIPTYSGRAEGIYMTLNPTKQALLARAANRIKAWSTLTTADSDVCKRRWLPIDIDPIRPSGISSTDAEHELALERAMEIQSWLNDQGWPMPILADSGNGAHLLYAIDLPNDAEAMQVVQSCLQAIASRFNDPQIAVDVGNYNAARIWKLYYTRAAKGDSTPERPHRWSKILSAESPPTIVTPTQLQQLAQLAPDQPLLTTSRTNQHFDVDEWFKRHAIEATKSKWKGGWRWKLRQCPFNCAHSDGAYVVQFSNGALSAGCHHNSCKGKGWRELRRMYETSDGFTERSATTDQLQEMIRDELGSAFDKFLYKFKEQLGAQAISGV